MRICYISGNSPRIFKLMEDMVSRGHKVYWVALSSPKYFIKGVSIYTDIVDVNNSFFKKFSAITFKYLIFQRLLKQIDPDILHAINVRRAGWFAAFSNFSPTFLSPQGGDVLVNDRDYNHLQVFKKWLKKSFIDKFLRSYTLNNVNVVTYGNENMLNGIKLWAKPKNTLHYFQGINFEKINLNFDQYKLKNALGLKQEKIIFCPRMFNSNSNIDIVIKSIPIVAKENPNIIYLFTCHLGVNTYHQKLIALIKELGVDKYCLFIDEIDPSDMNNYYSISDVVVSVLTSDGMPATILECLSMKIPQVLSDIPIYQTVFSDFVSIAKLRDTESTAELILKSLNRDAEIYEKIEKGYDWAFNCANQKILNDKLEEVYLNEIN